MKKALLRRTFFQIRWEPLGYHHTWVETGTEIPAGERLHPAWALLLLETIPNVATANKRGLSYRVRLNETLASTSIRTMKISRNAMSPLTAVKSAPLNRICLIALTE